MFVRSCEVIYAEGVILLRDSLLGGAKPRDLTFIWTNMSVSIAAVVELLQSISKKRIEENHAVVRGHSLPPSLVTIPLQLPLHTYFGSMQCSKVCLYPRLGKYFTDCRSLQ
jgi:hypothetical protein